MKRYAIVLDFGTNSVRAIVVDIADGQILGSSVHEYAHGERGVMGDARDPNVARQHPDDYLKGIQTTVVEALQQSSIDAEKVVGIGVDATGSTPLPVDETGIALGL